ncbi:MAG: hypothetical protein ABI921_04965 [Panacibacter sp.]
MKGFENEIYRYMLFVSTGISIIMLLVAIWWPRIARFLFFVLFAWAAYTNWQTSQQTPIVYVEYADLVWSNLYKNIINGWFAKHVELVVGVIAVCQGLIAISMLLKGVIFRIGAIGAIVFLAAIIPFGVGSGFPTTLIMCIALIIILRKHADDYIWQPNKAAVA